MNAISDSASDPPPPASESAPPGEPLLEEGTQVFVVRVRDERPHPAAAPALRGVIEHLPSGKRRHFHDLRAVAAFIAAYLPPGPPAGWARLRRWLGL